MAKEIERKYLVKNIYYRDAAKEKHHITQGYIHTDPRAVVRVRIKDDKAFITIKGRNDGAVRDEWEYPIPVDDAREMLERLSEGAIIDKTRWIVDYDGHRWEVDEFYSPLPGLTVAEIELASPDEKFTLPPFIGKEVTGDPAYYNSTIAATSH